MKLIITLLILLSYTLSCVASSSDAYYQKVAFLKLIQGTKGTRKYITTFPKSTLPCVYGEPVNKNAEKYIKQFFLLLKDEFKISKKPVFVSNLNNCPLDTGFYIFLHETGIKNSLIFKQFRDVYKRHKIKLFFPRDINGMGIITYAIGHTTAIGFASINQLTQEQQRSEDAIFYLKSLITEELFQMVTASKDMTKQLKIMSVTQESIHDNGSTRSANISAFSPSLQNNSKALCGYDLWFLILLSKYGENHINYRDFKKRFNIDYKKIKKRAQEIETNPAYKDLFDPRCSGKNTGINSKIGIE